MEENKQDIIRKTKEKTIAADSLDNNAPVHQIIEFLQSKHKKNKVFNYYSQLVKQRNTSWFSHYLYPGQTLTAFGNDWDGGLPSKFFETFAHRSFLPKMITTKVRNTNVTDPVTDIMSKKIDWNQPWQYQYRKLISLKARKQKVYEWLNEEVLHCPKDLVEVAEHWEKDPDIYFDASYNWYYAGNGNMQMISIGGDDYLVHSDMNCLYLSLFNRNNLTIEYEYEAKYKFPEKMLILETVVLQNIIAVRTKYKVVILKFTERNDLLELTKIKEMDSKLPLTGISFDEYHKNILYVTSLDYKLTIVNIDRMKGRSKQLKGRFETLANNWNTVTGSERMYFTHVTKSSLTLYDKRTNSAFERWKWLRDITDNSDCDFITSAKYCSNKPLMYIGTNHHMLLMDMRYSKIENQKVKPLQRWTHGMQSVPTYLSMCNYEHDKELICMSSQWCEDMCVVSNHNDIVTRDSNFRKTMTPYRPPSIFTTLHRAQQKMQCCDLHIPIRDRLSVAVTGLTLFECNEGYCILMQNSLGDISAHVLCPKTMLTFIDDDATEKLNEWSNLCKQSKQIFEVSYIKNIRKVLKNLKRVPDTYPIGENIFKKQKESEIDEKDIYDLYEKADLDMGLLDIWIKSNDKQIIPETIDQSI